jgi:replicative DNA helicase
MGETRNFSMPLTDVKAETATLGAMLVSDGHPLDCRDEVVDKFRDVGPGVFYEVDHQKIYQAIVDCMLDNRPTDPVSVVANLRRKGELTQALFDLVHELPRSAGVMTGAVEDASTILDLYRKRELHRVLMSSDNLVVSATGSYEEVAGEVSGAISDVVDRAVKPETLFSAIQVVDAALGHLFGERNVEPGIPMGIDDLDRQTGGMRPGQMIVIAGRPGHGKALALDTPIPTPTGWTTMGDIKVGDQVLGADGRPTRVTFTTEVQYNRACYKLTFSDGQTVVADADHLWETSTRQSRKAVYSANRKGYPAKSPYGVRTTKEIAETFLTADGRKNHTVRNTDPLDLPSWDLPVDPYVLGCWLGDGSSADGRIHTADEEIFQEIERRGYELADPVKQPEGRCPMRSVRGLFAKLRELGVANNKHIPTRYLRASHQQRLDLLRGLMDTDGTVHPDGTLVFSVTRKTLADGFRELLATLGYRWHESEVQKRAQSGDAVIAYYTGFSAPDVVFGLDRKIQAQVERGHYTKARSGHRVIETIEEVESVPVRCIQVDNVDHLYLCTKSMIPTHNTTVGAQIARNISNAGTGVVFFSLEMPKEELGQRNASAETGVPFGKIRDGKVDSAGLALLEQYVDEQEGRPLFVDDDPDQSVGEISLKTRKLIKDHDVKVVVIDYLQLVKPDGGGTGNKTQDIADVSDGLRKMARKLGITVIALAQLNRGVANRDDSKPRITDLRQSGEIEEDANIVILVHLEFKVNPETERGKLADLILAKNRGGITTEVEMLFDGEHSRFLDPALVVGGGH